MNIKINSARMDYFKIPFITPIRVGSKKNSFREGYILRLESEDGRIGLGELAPLSGLDTEELNSVSTELNSIVQSLNNSAMTLTGPVGLIKSKCVKFCLEGAFLDLAGKLMNQPPVEYCRLVVPGANSNWTDAKTVKIKIGRQSPREDIKLINQVIKKSSPKTRIRLDGNRGLSLEQFREIITNVDLGLIEYIEEPFCNLVTWERVRRKLPHSIPLAIDESLERVLRGDIKLPKGTSAFVLKPTLYGGVSDAMEIVNYTKQHYPHVNCVISSSFNTSVGISALVYLSNYENSNKNLAVAAGLDTYRFFDPPDGLIDLTYENSMVKVGTHT